MVQSYTYLIKSKHLSFIKMAEGEGFEPPVPFGTSVFKTEAINHSATPPLNLCHFQTTESTSRSRKLVGVDTQAVQHREQQVRQRVITLKSLVEGQVLAVLEAAAGEHDRLVEAGVLVGVTEVRTIENHRAIEQRILAFGHRLHVTKELREQLHVTHVERLELGQLVVRFAVVGEVVIRLGDRGVVDAFDHGGRDTVQHQGDRAGRVGLEGQLGQIVHDLHLFHVGRGARRIDRGLRVDLRLRLAFPALGGLQPLFEVADAGEVLVEAFTISCSKTDSQALCLICHCIENRAAGVELEKLGINFLLSSLNEELLEDLGGLVLGRNRHAGAGAGQTAATGIDRESQGWEAGQDADALCDVLVERDRVTEGARTGVWRAGDEANIGRMPTIDIRVRDATKDCEIVAVLLQQFQIGRRLIVLVIALREEIAGQQA